MDAAAIPTRLDAVRQRIARACARADRAPAEVALVAVSKQVPLDLVAAACAAGQLDFGENRIQTALPRQADLARLLLERGVAPPALRWHFIGALQANKVNKATGAFALLHGVDSLDLAQRLDRRAAQLGVKQPILLEVNVAAERQKHGLDPADLLPVATAIATLPHLDLRGLMAMARFGASEAEARATFARVRELRDQAQVACARPLRELSMGMSDDYEAAVAEGATLVRVGTAIFGDRLS